MHPDGAAAARVRSTVLALLLLIGLLTVGARQQAVADDGAAAPPLLLATASITRTYIVGQEETFSTRTAKVGGTIDTGLWIDWDDGSGPTVSFDSSRQRPLHPGVFADVGADNGTPSVTVYGNLYFSTVHGEFDVRDLAVDSDGRFTRFDIVFTTSTTYPTNAAFGEVRLNEDPASQTVAASANALRWPLVRRHSDPLWVVETLTNTSGSKVKLGKARLSSGATSDYRIRKDRCNRTTLAPSASCTLQVGFSPSHGGPRAAALVVPAGKRQVMVTLVGAGMIGTTKLTVSGSYAPDKKTTVYRDVLVNPRWSRTGATAGYQFIGSVETRGRPHGFDLDLGGPRPFGRGTHPTHENLTPGEAYQFGLLLDYRCYNMAGTITVRDFRTDKRNVPTEADIDLRQHCEGAALEGRLQWQDRKDTRAPSKPKRLRVTGGKARWTASRTRDLSATVVRVVPGSGTDATPLSGYAVSSSRATSARLPHLRKGQTYTLLAFSLDKTGNASAPARLTLGT